MSVWDAAVGQREVIEPLIRATTDPHTMTHAWLITGPPGSGRSVVARAFAAALECSKHGCGHCEVCTTVMAGTHPDVTTVATQAVTLSVAEVRDLVSVAARMPSTAPWRIVLIEDADRMTERTSNVLLKAIEEPTDRTVWLLCAPSTQDIIVTIRSRSRHVGLRVPPIEEVVKLLVEKEGIDPEVARAAALASQSHIGIARRLAKDPQAARRRLEVLRIPENAQSIGQAVIAAGKLVEVAMDEGKQIAENHEAEERAELLRSLGIEDPSAKIPPALRVQIRQFEEDAKRRATRRQRDVLDRALVDLLSYYRDVLVVQTGAGLEFVNTELAAGISDTAAGLTPEATVAAMDAIEQARGRLAGNVAPALALEALMVRLVSMRGNAA